jgi:hypothetical protein
MLCRLGAEFGSGWQVVTFSSILQSTVTQAPFIFLRLAEDSVGQTDLVGGGWGVWGGVGVRAQHQPRGWCVGQARLILPIEESLARPSPPHPTPPHPFSRGHPCTMCNTAILVLHTLALALA